MLQKILKARKVAKVKVPCSLFSCQSINSNTCSTHEQFLVNLFFRASCILPSSLACLHISRHAHNNRNDNDIKMKTEANKMKHNYHVIRGSTWNVCGNTKRYKNLRFGIIIKLKQGLNMKIMRTRNKLSIHHVVLLTQITWLAGDLSTIKALFPQQSNFSAKRVDDNFMNCLKKRWKTVPALRCARTDQ